MRLTGVLEAAVQPGRLMELAAPTPSMCTWHHCSPYAPEPKWSVNPPNVSAPPPLGGPRATALLCGARGVLVL
jgi:hypothetical protein